MIAAAATAPPELAVRVRNAVESDTGFVLDTWRNSWRLTKANKRRPAAVVNFQFDTLVKGGILLEPDTRIIVACDRYEPDTIFGWACFTPGSLPVLHFAYVKKDKGGRLRGGGLFGILLHAIGLRDEGDIVYTMRPAEYSHKESRRFLGVEDGLLDAAKRRGILAKHVPADQWLGRGKR